MIKYKDNSYTKYLKNKINKIIYDIKHGKPIIIIDDDTRENEADLFIAAKKSTTDNIAFMVRNTSGILCAPMIEKDLNRLSIPIMVNQNQEHYKTNYCVSVDAHNGITTGISAYDRCKTLHVLSDAHSKDTDINRPGHIFPLKSAKYGTLERRGHTESATDLLNLSKIDSKVGVISELINYNGSVKNREEAKQFAAKHRLNIIYIKEIVYYRWITEHIITHIGSAKLPTKYGHFDVHAFKNIVNNKEYTALTCGDYVNGSNVLVRIHSECLTGNVYHSLRCDCDNQLIQSMRIINNNKCGVIVYATDHEGRGIGIGNKILAYTLQDQGMDTVEANYKLGFKDDIRDYNVASQIIKSLKIESIVLLTNNYNKSRALSNYGIKVNSISDITTKPNRYNIDYMRIKQQKMNHKMDI